MTPQRVQPDQEPQRADLMPAAITYRCPACHHTGECDDFVEGDLSGERRITSESRYVHCEGCGAHLDIGWAGWNWHDAGAREGGGEG